MAAAGATAVLIAVATGLILGMQGPGSTPGRNQGVVARTTAVLRAHLLSALAAAADDVLSVHRASSIADGEALNEEVWLSPSQPSPRQQVESRSLIMDASGSSVQDFAVTFAMPADPAELIGPSVGVDATGAPAPALRVTGSTIDVDYPSLSWSEQRDHSTLVAFPDDLATVRIEIASESWTIGTTAIVNGQPAIELAWSGAPAGVTHELWVNGDTYLPIREVYARPVVGTLTSDYLLLPPTAANMAELTPSVPAGFTRELPADA